MMFYFEKYILLILHFCRDRDNLLQYLSLYFRLPRIGIIVRVLRFLIEFLKNHVRITRTTVVPHLFPHFSNFFVRTGKKSIQEKHIQYQKQLISS